MYDKMQAKKDILKNLKKEMASGDDLGLSGKMKKVTVMSDSDEGLNEGLSKAEQILQKRKKLAGVDESESEESEAVPFGGEETPEEEEAEESEMLEDMSAEQIQQKIEMLQKMLSSKK